MKRTHGPIDADPLLRTVFRNLLRMDWEDIMPARDRAAAIERFKSDNQRWVSRMFWRRQRYVSDNWAEAKRLGLTKGPDDR